MGGGNSALSISVLTENISSKGLVTGGYLDSGASIGVTVTNTSGGNYDNTAYNNIKFTSSGTGTSQKWSGGTVKLSATDGYCYAYYPYSSSATSITAIPVTAGGTDYMYATPVTVNDKDKNATLNMKHALSAIRLALKKGTYAGTGAVSSVSVASSALGSSGTLNAKTGGVTAASLGTAVSQSASFNLSTTAQNVDVVMVPSGKAGAITLSVTIDGKVYSTEVASTTIKQGSCYTYTITVDAGSLALSGVKVGDWGYDDSGSPVITAGGYTVTLTGDIDSMGFFNELKEDGSVRITALSMRKDVYIQTAVCNQGTITQNYDETKRVIDIAEVTGNMEIAFNGYGILEEHQVRFFPAGTYTWAVPENMVDKTGTVPNVVDVFLVGGGGGSSTAYGAGSGYTKAFRGIGYVQPENGTWEGTAEEGRDGNAVNVSGYSEIEVIVGAGGVSTSEDKDYSGGFSQFLNENYKVNGGGSFSAGGSSGYGYSNGNGYREWLCQGHTTRDFGEKTGKINAGGGGTSGNPSTAGGGSHYSEGSGGNGSEGKQYYGGDDTYYYGGGGGGGYGGGGGGVAPGLSNHYSKGGDGTVLLRYWNWVKK